MYKQINKDSVGNKWSGEYESKMLVNLKSKLEDCKGALCPDCNRKLKQSKIDPDKLVCVKECGYEWVWV